MIIKNKGKSEMNKPARVLAYVFAGVFLGVILILAIPIFTHSAHYLVSEALTFLLLGGLGISVGIILMQKVRAKGERIPWWKQSLIIIGIGYILMVRVNLDAISRF